MKPAAASPVHSLMRAPSIIPLNPGRARRRPRGTLAEIGCSAVDLREPPLKAGPGHVLGVLVLAALELPHVLAIGGPRLPHATLLLLRGLLGGGGHLVSPVAILPRKR